MTVAALPISGIAAMTSPAVMSQNVPQASPRLVSGIRSARVVMNGTKPQMKKVVHTSTFRTPCSVRLW